MIALLVEMLGFVLAAALIGLLLGFLVWGWGQRDRIAAARADGAMAARTSVDGEAGLGARLQALEEERARLEAEVDRLTERLALLGEAPANDGAALNTVAAEGAAQARPPVAERGEPPARAGWSGNPAIGDDAGEVPGAKVGAGRGWPAARRAVQPSTGLAQRAGAAGAAAATGRLMAEDAAAFTPGDAEGQGVAGGAAALGAEEPDPAGHGSGPVGEGTPDMSLRRQILDGYAASPATGGDAPLRGGAAEGWGGGDGTTSQDGAGAGMPRPGGDKASPDRDEEVLGQADELPRPAASTLRHQRVAAGEAPVVDEQVPPPVGGNDGSELPRPAASTLRDQRVGAGEVPVVDEQVPPPVDGDGGSELPRPAASTLRHQRVAAGESPVVDEQVPPQARGDGGSELPRPAASTLRHQREVAGEPPVVDEQVPPRAGLAAAGGASAGSRAAFGLRRQRRRGAGDPDGRAGGEERTTGRSGEQGGDMPTPAVATLRGQRAQGSGEAPVVDQQVPVEMYGGTDAMPAGGMPRPPASSVDGQRVLSGEPPIVDEQVAMEANLRDPGAPPRAVPHGGVPEPMHAAPDGLPAREMEMSPQPPVPETAGSARPAAAGGERLLDEAETGDDLRRIRGVGKVMEGLLHARGIRSYRQIAGLGDAEAERLATDLGAPAGRVAQQRWVEQARVLHREKYGREHDGVSG